MVVISITNSDLTTYPRYIHMDKWTKIRSEYLELESARLDHEINMVSRERRFYQGMEKVIYFILIGFMVGILYAWFCFLMSI